MVHETRKIMGDDTIDVCPTCVRVPVLHSHSESILVETDRPITPEAARAVWAGAPGLTSSTTRRQSLYPLPDSGPATATTSSSAGFARTSPAPTPCSSGASSDNLRKGAALNAVQIAEELLKLDPASVRNVGSRGDPSERTDANIGHSRS